MCKRLSRSDGFPPEESCKNCRQTQKKTRLREESNEALSLFMSHETLSLAPQACSEPRANRKDLRAHHDGTPSPWRSCPPCSYCRRHSCGRPSPHCRRFFSGHQHFHPWALVQVSPATQRLPDGDYPFCLPETASACSLHSAHLASR